MIIIVLALLGLLTILACTESDINIDEVKDKNCVFTAFLTTFIFPIGIVQAVRNKNNNNKPWYIRYMLFILPPLGIFLLWNTNTFNKSKKKGLTIVAVFLMIFTTLFVVSLEEKANKQFVPYENVYIEDEDSIYGEDQVRPEDMQKYMFEYTKEKTENGVEFRWNYVPIIEKVVINRSQSRQEEYKNYIKVGEVSGCDTLYYIDTSIDRNKDYEYEIDIIFDDGTSTTFSGIVVEKDN